MKCAPPGSFCRIVFLQLVFIAVVAALPGPVAAYGAGGPSPVRHRWTFFGPEPVFDGSTRFSGRIDVAVPDPLNPNVMYVGAGDGGGTNGGGIWKTSNWMSATPTWAPLTDKFPSLAIFSKSLTLFPGKHGGVLYAAVQGPNGGILRSKDGGAHWKYLASRLFSNSLFGAIVVSPADKNTVYVAAGGSSTNGAYKSIDGGKHWANITSTSIGLGNATDIVVDPQNSSTLYVGIVNGAAPGASNGGVYRSLDGGQTWTPMSLPLPSGFTIGDFIALKISPGNSNYVYATVFGDDNTAPNPDLQRFRTIDGGTSWNLLTLPHARVPNLCHSGDPNNTLQDFRFWHVVLGIDPNNPEVVYANACEPSFVVSTDGGSTWGPMPTVDDVVNVFFDDQNNLVLVGDRGIHLSADPLDPTPSFSSQQGNLGNFLFQSFSLDPLNLSIIYGIVQDQLSGLQYTGNTTWNYLAEGTEVGRTLVNPSNDNVVYTWGVDNGSIRLSRSEDGGQNWSSELGGLDASDFGTADMQADFNSLALDPDDPARLVLGGFHVWEAMDQGPSQPLSWSMISPAPLAGGNLIGAIAFAPGSNGQVIYAATAGGQLFVTSNGGSSWNNISPQPSIPEASTTSIVIDPADPNRVFVNTAGPQGSGWNLSNSVAPVGGRVWMTTDGGASWASIAGNLPANLTVKSIAADFRRSKPVLFAGTDRSVFGSRNLGKSWTKFGRNLPTVDIQDMEFIPQTGTLGVATFGRGVWEMSIR